jgi:GrpB-like predicted nucleotidyltransferase (UPF0157 family)
MAGQRTPAFQGTHEPIRIQPYDANWPTLFAIEAELIQAAIGPWITGGIHHVGSTAVPGLAAKPTIDIQVGVADLAASWPCIDLLTEVRYLYAPYRTDEMHWFCKPHPGRRTHHPASGTHRLTEIRRSHGVS